jgi:hypothetical protein
MREEIQKAQIHFQENELTLALGIVNGCILANSSDVQALLLRGKINFKSQKWGEAMNDYATVLEFEPSNQEAKSGLEMTKNILAFYTPDLFNP